MKFGFPFSINLLFWGVIGIIRLIEEKVIRRKKYIPLFLKPREAVALSLPEPSCEEEKILFYSKKAYEKRVENVAACIAARNEEKGLQKTIDSIVSILPAKNCYIVSDGSTDTTVNIARSNKCKILVNKRPLGKAKALEALFEKFKLLDRYEYVFFADADTQIDKNYLRNALPVFEDKRVACIAAYARSEWRDTKFLSYRNFFVAYRARLYKLLQIFLMYGQTWYRLNVISVIPGFASMYRTTVLKQLKIDVPGIAIEDFNLAFQVQHKKLGIIAHYPSIIATAQDPSNLDDYVKQVERWVLGFFQTVRHHGVWPSLFWFFLGLFIIEVFIAAIFYFPLPIFVVLVTMPELQQYIDQTWIPISSFLDRYESLWAIIFGVFIIDYFLTFIVAVIDKRPVYLIYGLGFIFLRILDSIIFLTTAPRGLFVRSRGVWTSPGRR